MAFKYAYLADIDSWTGPSYLATRELVFGGNGYNALLETPTQSIHRSSDPSSRSNCGISVINSVLSGTRFSDSHFADRLEGKQITITQLDLVSLVSRVVYIGVVLSVEINELQVGITLVEPSYSRSKVLGGKVSSEVWPNARPSDVGGDIGLPIGSVENSRFPHVQYNFQSRTEESILSTDTTLIVDDITGFVLGTAFINEEQVTITNIDVPLKTLTVTRVKATDHPSGEPIIMGGNFSIAIDSSGKLSGINDMKEFQSEEKIFPVRNPDVHSTTNGIRIATWFGSTPTYKEPVGDLSSIGIEFDNKETSNCINPNNALGRVGTFSERNFASIKGAGQNKLNALLDRYIRPKGKIKKVLALVEHTGNRNNNMLGSGQLNVSTPHLGGFIGNLFLTTNDRLDADFLEIAEQKGRRSVDVPDAGSLTTGVFTPDVITAQQPTGSPFTTSSGRFKVAGDEAITHDGNDTTFVDTILHLIPGTGMAFSGLKYTFSALPSPLMAADAITKLTIRFKHGSVKEDVFITPLTGGLVIFEGATNLSGFSTFTQSTAPVIHSQSVAVTKTGADLLNMNFFVDLNWAIGTPAAVWTMFEVDIEIEYTPTATTAVADSGSVSTHFDLTTACYPSPVTWDDLFNTNLQVIGDGGNFYSVFHVGLIIIYEPQETRFVNQLVGTVLGAVSGDPAQVLETLWTDSAIGNNPASSITNVAATSASLQAAGYVFSASGNAIGGIIRNAELWEVMLLIAREVRTFLYMVNGVITLEFIGLISSLASPTLTITRDIIMPSPTIRSSDLEQQVKNRYNAEFDQTDAEGFRQEIQRENTASVTAYGELLDEVQFRFVKTLAQVDATLAIYLDRLAYPWDQVSFALTQDHRILLDPLTRIKLSIGWLIINKFEVTEIEERWDHILAITGRSL